MLEPVTTRVVPIDAVLGIAAASNLIALGATAGAHADWQGAASGASTHWTDGMVWGDALFYELLAGAHAAACLWAGWSGALAPRTWWRSLTIAITAVAAIAGILVAYYALNRYVLGPSFGDIAIGETSHGVLREMIPWPGVSGPSGTAGSSAVLALVAAFGSIQGRVLRRPWPLRPKPALAIQGVLLVVCCLTRARTSSAGVESVLLGLSLGVSAFWALTFCLLPRTQGVPSELRPIYRTQVHACMFVLVVTALFSAQPASNALLLLALPLLVVMWVTKATSERQTPQECQPPAERSSSR